MNFSICDSIPIERKQSQTIQKKHIHTHSLTESLVTHSTLRCLFTANAVCIWIMQKKELNKATPNQSKTIWNILIEKYMK